MLSIHWGYFECFRSTRDALLGSLCSLSTEGTSLILFYFYFLIFLLNYT